MPGDFRPSNSKFAGSILAACIVGLFGALGIAFVSAASGGDPVITLGVILGGACGLFLIIWLLNTTSNVSPSACYHWVFSKNARPKADYEPRRKRTQKEDYGTQKPASAEEVKDLKDGLRNWVPSKTREGRSHLKE
ncbi:hypothetical protein [Thalassoglobus polymorphus]|uniref:MraY-like glycosyltransferase n=1 Tax=Thalassoglobus polymorphus TaxID=2527994 RepID=A0A517QSI9_9PLAN|nr:hypothetical protein [Thalassoglobus polymorphus]QDT34581.1 MraY-like glycosyltransferase [Thalassoglobus polymorphus]